MEIVLLIIGLATGFFIGFLFMRLKTPSQEVVEHNTDELDEKIHQLQDELQQERNQLKFKIADLATSQAQLEAANEKCLC